MAANNTRRARNKNSKVVDAGSFGIVFYPALENDAENGSPVENPGKVTKLFYTKAGYDEAIKIGRNLQERLPDVAYNLKPYRRKFKYSDFSRNADFIEKYHGHERMPNTELYALGMPYLGTDLLNILRSRDLHNRFLALSDEAIYKAILQLFYDVKSFKDADLLHGDIKMENILFNFDTATFQLIDFDFVDDWDRFKGRRQGFTRDGTPRRICLGYHPPEFYVATITRKKLKKALEKIQMINIRTNPDLQEVKYIHEYGRFVDYDRAFNPDELPAYAHMFQYGNIVPDIMDQVIWLAKKGSVSAGDKYSKYMNINAGRSRFLGEDDKVKLFHNRCKETFDSYCTGLALFSMLTFIDFHNRRSERFKPIVKEILMPMISRKFITERITIEEAIAKLGALMRERFPGVNVSRIRREAVRPVEEVIEEGAAANIDALAMLAAAGAAAPPMDVAADRAAARAANNNNNSNENNSGAGGATRKRRRGREGTASGSPKEKRGRSRGASRR
jgi:serine/threonine protein kinase